MPRLKIIPVKYLEDYKKSIDFNLKRAYDKIEYKEFKEDIFYYNTNAVASSAQIEGENVSSQDLIQYFKHKKKFRPGYINATADLFNAYVFAQNNSLNTKNILKAHEILSEHFLQKNARGKIRNHDEIIYHSDGNIVYTAAPKQIVADEFQKLCYDIKTLLQRKLTIKETFYFAFMTSLVFVKIHPFEDGNGRMSRLLEKWFLAEKLDKRAWFIPSELNYFRKQKSYFLALNRMGLFYEDTDYSKALKIATLTAKLLKNN